ncbi:MAG: GvpL/GvpF family gas vesicle protein [Roseicyclus sp.]
MIYLYGLLASASPASCDAIRSLGGVTGPVDVAVTDMGAIVFGRADAAEFAPKRRNLLAHAKVLEACQALGDLLPMRFGMTARDEAEIVRTLRLNRTEIESQFDRIRGHVEFGLKIAFPREAALQATIAADRALDMEYRRLGDMARPPHFATAEFGRRLAEALDRRRTDAQRRMLPELASLCRDHVLATPEEDVQVLNLHVLAPPEMGDTLARAAQAEAAASGFVPSVDAQVRLIGPEPPFHFVQVALSTSSTEAA